MRYEEIGETQLFLTLTKFTCDKDPFSTCIVQY